MALLLDAANSYQSEGLKSSNTELLDTANAISRSILVLLAGHLEAYLNDFANEVCGALPAKWDAASIPKKVMIIHSVISGLDALLSEQDRQAPRDEPELNRFRTRAEKILTALSKPQAIQPVRLEGFYRLGGPQALAKLISSLSPAGPDFFKWIENIGANRSRLWVTLESVSKDRSQIAHGNLLTSGTPEDARLAILVVAATARYVERYSVTYGLL